MARNLNIDKSIKSLIPLAPSNLDTVDAAMFDFVNEKLNISCTTNKGWRKVPVIWAGQERSKQAKDNPDIRDINSSLIFPIISIQRETPKKSQESKGKFYANIPPRDDYKGGSIVIATRIKQDKTQNFADADAFRKAGGPITIGGTRTINENVGPGKINFPRRLNKVVYEIASMPQPVYFEAPYKIKIKTEYAQQMNEIVQPFIVNPGSVKRVMLSRDGYRYEAFIQEDFSQKNNTEDMTTEARTFETEITIKVFGYVIGAGPNQEKPVITIRENIVQIKIGREHVIVGDIIPSRIGDPLKPGTYRP